ncbi:shikimate dehydrogenase [Bradyrhizobium prioriisuperbiae]|uniref:shikimate dehydrogenase family protein n=1 Tax=Bradyrhizobium prioriisuperbiae TaxID=2854389 RepID=UPI0028F0D027|nr:shikimate dehydrogenase [Bradyrhizobium prioritasuperba]
MANAPASEAIGLDNDFPNGQLRIYGLIGDPVSQVRAPSPMTQRLRQAGLNAALLPLHVPAVVLPIAFGGLKLIRNLDGLVITVPHKIPMAELVDRCSERARLVGAINVARREADSSWSGDILDGVGFVRGLIDRGFDPNGQSAFVIGAGGAGCAVAMELVLAGASVRVFDVSAARANALAARMQQANYSVASVETADPRGAALVVNATPLGMREDDPLPLDPALLSPEMLVAEVVMKPPVTAFLKHAMARGCQTQLGEAVMLYQLDAQVEFFRKGLA